MSKHGPRQPDPFADQREWQDHRYDPGYFLGGRIHPILKGSRPNRYGWMLLAGGLLGFAFIFSLPHGENAWWQYALAGAYGLLYIVAGIRLLKRRPDHPSHSSSHHRHRRTRKGNP
jgi:hypothetical protein